MTSTGATRVLAVNPHRMVFKFLACRTVRISLRKTTTMISAATATMPWTTQLVTIRPR